MVHICSLECGHPRSTKSFPLDKVLSLDVHCSILAAVTEVEFIDSITRMVFGRTGILDGAFTSGSQPNRSAFA